MTYFIKNAENLTLIPEGIKDEGLEEANKEADKQSWSKQELEDYERASIKERDDIGRIEFAEKKRVKTIAKNMKFNNEPTEKIIKYTGLTEDEIEQL